MRKPTDMEQQALRVIAEALTGAPKGKEQETLTIIATIAICMMHGTFGKEYTAGFLRGAVDDVASPDALTIQLEVRDAASH